MSEHETFRSREAYTEDSQWRNRDEFFQGRAAIEVGIQHPLVANAVAAVIEVTDLAVGTFGEYERGPHVIDPHTGTSPRDVLSVTITGPDLATADAYATATLAMASPARTGRHASGATTR